MTLEKVNNRLKVWAKDRNITFNKFSLELRIDNHLEEEAEYVLALENKDISELIDALCDKYIYSYTNSLKIGITELEQDICERICDIQLNHMKALGYNGILCLDECIKHIESRTQDPKQQVEWELNGPSGKWKKDESTRDSWYEPDYDKCYRKIL